ncbi:hypothetical protein H2200_001282 [Cladophialophora chaetospira]|uniref:BZIP domain-containing protein n=1 Tax=Cladophialophora chaetospira TaxID=386627 RepID=A0AA38XLI6_9EURO|nr:hypothetical protein H2200_001282 [Cladophialophora chaetospira]
MQDMDWTPVNGFMDQVPQQYDMAQSPSAPWESGTVTMSLMENDSQSGAENDAPSPRRRRKARMNEVDEETQLRRRAQNRDSQQAYRQRREEYIQGLQGQIVDLHLRHRDLWSSYLSQGRRVGLLREVAADLGSEIMTLRQRQGQASPVASDNVVVSQGEQSYAMTASGFSDPRHTTAGANLNPGTRGSAAPGTRVMGAGKGLQVPSTARLERKLH